MNRIGLLRIERSKLGAEGNWIAEFPEAVCNMYLETVQSQSELLTKEISQKIFGYRLHLDFEITRFPDSYYNSVYGGLDIEEQAINLANMLNETPLINLPNREFRVYPDYGNNDFFGIFLLKSDSIDYQRSSSYLNLGQKLNLEFYHKKYCDGQTYKPYTEHAGFYLPDYFSIGGISS